MERHEVIRTDRAVMESFWNMYTRRENFMLKSFPAAMCGQRMELMAVIRGLEALNRPCEVELYSDSQYVVNAFNQHWIEGWIKKGWKRGKNEPVKNTDLWKRLLEAKKPHQVNFNWVKGHDGHPQNERCDTLATTAADGNELQVDPGV